MVKVKAFVGVILCGIMILVTVIIANGSQNDKRLLYKSLQLRGELSNERHYEFLLSLKRYPGNDSLPNSPIERYWGATASKPVTLIDKFSLSVSGRDFQVPREAILGFANAGLPCGVFIGERADTILVHFEGGDGLDAYNARLSFVNGQLQGRLIEYYGKDGEWKHSSSKY